MSIINFTVIDSTVVRELEKDDANYLTAHGAAAAESYNIYETLTIGQDYRSEVYAIDRAVFGFDTSGLGDLGAVVIKSAYLTIKGNFTHTDDYSGVTLLKNGQPDYPTMPNPVSTDYAIANYSGNGGSIKPEPTDETAILNFNYTGLSWINKSGYSKFMLVSQEDNNTTLPTGNN